MSSAVCLVFFFSRECFFPCAEGTARRHVCCAHDQGPSTRHSPANGALCAYLLSLNACHRTIRHENRNRASAHHHPCKPRTPKIRNPAKISPLPSVRIAGQPARGRPPQRRGKPHQRTSRLCRRPPPSLFWRSCSLFFEKKEHILSQLCSPIILVRYFLFLGADFRIAAGYMIYTCFFMLSRNL